jgi:hypothetical protein
MDDLLWGIRAPGFAYNLPGIIMTEQIGKFLVILGGVLLLSGILFLLINRFFGDGEFPGAINIETGSFSISVPILASILVSIILTVVLNLVIRWINK